MKKLLFVVLACFGMVLAQGQELPKDVAKIFKMAEKLQDKKEYDSAIEAYKEVLRSVPDHVQSMENIGDIESRLRPKPNYRQACESYEKALEALSSQIQSTNKKAVQAVLGQKYKEIEPKKNYACSHVEDFDDAKERRQRGNRLLEEEGL